MTNETATEFEACVEKTLALDDWQVLSGSLKASTMLLDGVEAERILAYLEEIDAILARRVKLAKTQKRAGVSFYQCYLESLEKARRILRRLDDALDTHILGPCETP